MIKYWRYLSYVVRHKWAVGRECWRRGLYRRALLHDLSKLLPDEFVPYAHHFAKDIKVGRDRTGYYKPYDTGDPEFDAAWLRHQKRNDHHWQYWTAPNDGTGYRTIEMPEDVATEMVCDWLGAAAAQHNPTPVWEWFEEHRGQMQLHTITEMRILALLDQLRHSV